MADLTAVPWDQFSLSTRPQDQVSKNFKYFELIKSETAERQLIDNSITDADVLQSAI